MLKCGLIWLSPAFVSAARYCNLRVVAPPGVLVGMGVNVGPTGVVGVIGVFVGPPPPEYQTRTGSQSRKKSREVLLDTLTIRTRKLAPVNSLLFQVRPQVSLALPR